MKNPQNITLALLLATAVVLGSILFSTYQSQDNAAYASPAIKGGDYLMAQGAISNSVDLLYVIDVPSRRLNAYYVNINNNSVEIVDSVDLSRAFSE